MDYFDARANGWDENPMHVERALLTYKAIARHVRLKDTLDCLEYGSGTGLLSFYLQPHVKSITLYDTSARMLEVASEKIRAGRIANMRTLSLDIASDAGLKDRYDLVYTLMTLHHVADTAKIVSLFHGLLREGGALAVADLVKEDGSFHSRHDGFSGHNGFDVDRLSRTLEDAGFVSIESEVYYTIEREFDEGSKKSYPVFLLVCKKEGSHSTRHR